jgi:hypothetical protein
MILRHALARRVMTLFPLSMSPLLIFPLIHDGLILVPPCT